MIVRLSTLAMLLGLFACKSHQHAANLETRKNEVVLVNTSGERCEMGELLNLIAMKDPKVIGINFIYTKEKAGACDSLLLQSLVHAKNVILIEGYRDGREIPSDEKFLNVVMESAQAGYLGDERYELNSYYRLGDLGKGLWRYTFPFEIASLYDTAKAAYLASISKPGVGYPIKFRYQKSGFKVLNGRLDVENSENLLENKIVLIGLLEGDDEDLFSTPGNSTSRNKYGTVVLANIILNILEDLDKPGSGNPVTNKYLEFVRKQQLREDRSR